MKQLILGYLENNCYLIGGKDGKTLYVIDPAAEAEKIVECARHHFTFEQVIILLTHAHADHIGAIKQLYKELPVSEVMLSAEDLPLYQSKQNCIPPWLPPQSDLPETIAPHDTEDFLVIATPGHTPGGVCYYFKQVGMLFSGDTLFYRSVGRTDLPGGSSEILTASIRTKLFTLPQETQVLPGHGPSSTIQDEKKFNPYV